MTLSTLSTPTAVVTIAPGTTADLLALLPLHYRRRPPRGVVRILAARDEAAGLIGVLAVSTPALNSPLRDLAWPGRYRTGHPRADACRLNAEVRTISRVIVHPSWRGRGIARRLVRTYLDRPLTPATEALAAHGRRSRFFEHAGMQRYDLPPGPARARLADAAAFVGLRAADLRNPTRALAAFTHLPPRRRALLDRELRRWADGSRGTRRLADGPIADLLLAAGAALRAARPCGYAHVAGAPSW